MLNKISGSASCVSSLGTWQSSKPSNLAKLGLVVKPSHQSGRLGRSQYEKRQSIKILFIDVQIQTEILYNRFDPRFGVQAPSLTACQDGREVMSFHHLEVREENQIQLKSTIECTGAPRDVWLGGQGINSKTL